MVNIRGMSTVENLLTGVNRFGQGPTIMRRIIRNMGSRIEAIPLWQMLLESGFLITGLILTGKPGRLLMGCLLPSGRIKYGCCLRHYSTSIGTAVPLTTIPPVAGISTVSRLGRPIASP